MMSPQKDGLRRRRALDPIDRFAEILFGIIMVMTSTGSVSVAESGRDEIRTMLFAAIGCNLAWGIVDGVMYLLTILSERGRGLLALQRIRQLNDPAAAHQIISEALPPVVAAALREPELELVRQRLTATPGPAKNAGLSREDYVGALAVMLLVFLSTFPVVLPFLVMTNATHALRVSNAIGIGILFISGYLLGRHVSSRPWRLGMSMVLIGVLLVGITIAMGG